MKTGRFFVTVVVLLGIASTVSCEVSRSRRNAAQAETERKAALVQEGNARILESEKIRDELRATYGMHIANVPRSKDKVTGMATPEKFNWKEVAVERRREIQAKLAQYLQLINRVLEIDSERLITVENREKLITSRVNAEAFQRSLEAAEHTLGENYTPKRDSHGQVPQQQVTDLN